MRDEARLAPEREAHQRKRGQYQGFSSFDVVALGGPAQQQQQQQQQQGEGGGWHAAPGDGGHLARDGADEAAPQPGSPGGLRAAGETKGVSMEDNRRYLAALKRLLDLPGNRSCADCAGSDAG